MEIAAEPVHIALPPFALDGVLTLPPDARAVVLFGCTRGRSRPSRCQRAVAGALGARGLGTGLFDLLTWEEQSVPDDAPVSRFDLDVVAGRLAVATDWVAAHPETRDLPVGYFGCGVGGVAALVAATERAGAVRALVAVGGRPGGASATLASVACPTLLLAAERDRDGRTSSGAAFEALRRTEDRRLEVVADARARFGSRAAIARVASLATEWFERFL
jgi:hypothetical protein